MKWLIIASKQPHMRPFSKDFSIYLLGITESYQTKIKTAVEAKRNSGSDRLIESLAFHAVTARNEPKI